METTSAFGTFRKSEPGPATSAVRGRPDMTPTARHFAVGPEADVIRSRRDVCFRGRLCERMARPDCKGFSELG
jgi:hypothetical protein